MVMASSSEALRHGLRAVLADTRSRVLPASLVAELSAMQFVASKAASHPPVYKVFRTTHRGKRLVGWSTGLRSLDARMQAVMGCSEKERSESIEALKQHVVSAVTAAASSLAPHEELAVTATLTERADGSGSGADAHVLAEPFETIATPCVAALTPPQAPPSREVASDPWRVAGWATPGVHPALGLDSLPPGAEEVLLTRPGLLPGAPPLVVEGLNSNVAVLHVSPQREPALTLCSGGYTGATAQAVHAGREASLRRQALGWECSRGMRAALGACTAQLRHAEQDGLEQGRWGAAWLLCKFRGARRLHTVVLPDGDERRLRSSEIGDRVHQLVTDWVLAAWRADSVRVERILHTTV